MKQLGLRRSCITHCLCLIIFYVTGVNSLTTMLSQIPESSTQLVNQTFEISCTVKGESMDNLGLYWYRKTEKSEDLEFIVSAPTQLEKYSYGTNIIQKKFTMRRAYFQSYFTLKITDLEYSDSGVYYCMAVKTVNTYTFGNGTRLTVVDTLPTTVKPTTMKPPCKCKKPKPSKPSSAGVRCNVVIWAPLSGLALILLIGIYLLASHTYRVYRRTHMYFRKYSPK